jgi:hypothetical protein
MPGVVKPKLAAQPRPSSGFPPPDWAAARLFYSLREPTDRSVCAASFQPLGGVLDHAQVGVTFHVEPRMHEAKLLHQIDVVL